MSQEDKIIYYMRTHGHITKMDSAVKLGITNLGARIGELRQSGWEIITNMVENPKTLTKYAKYVILSNPSGLEPRMKKCQAK